MKHASKFDNAVVSYGKWLMRWRWPVAIGSILLALAIGSGAQKLWFDTNYRVFFSDENPQLLSFEALQDIYTKNDNILIVLEPKGGDVFEPGVLSAVEELTKEAWQIPFAIRVDAITNFQHTEANGDELLVGDLVTNGASLDAAELEKVRQISYDEPVLYRRLISDRGHVTAINVTLQQPGESAEEVPQAVAFTRKMMAEFEAEHPDINTYLSGQVMLNNAFSETGMKDMQTLIPLMYLLMFVVMIWLLRSFSATLATIAVIVLSTMVAMGFGGWFGIGLTPPSAQAPTMIMTLAIADSIHILITMLREMRQGLSKRDALVESLRINMQPVFLTSLTTVIGFLSMNFSDAPPFHHLGNMTAVGVTAAFFFSVLFLPALVAILPVKVKQRAEAGESPRFERFADGIIRYRRGLLWGTSALVILMIAFIPNNELNDKFVNYFDKSISFRTDSDFASENLTGIYQVEFSLEAGESGGISNPEYLRTLDAFAEWYRSRPNVVHVSSFSEVMKRVNKSMHSDLDSWYSIPESRELAAQYLLLYELSLPYGLDLNNQINVDKSATRFTVTLQDVSAREIRESAAIGEEWLRENAPKYMHAYSASSSIMFAHISERNIKGMLTGTAIALLLISLALVVALRSFKYGAISLLPNIIPAAMAFGAWGLFVGQINLGLSIVSGMTLGIVVDDTVHFLSKYVRARRERNLNPQEAVRYAFSTVGLALVVTSIILALGFGILAFSAFDLNAGMGKLTAITIGLALLMDFFLLPPLLMKLEEKRESARNTEAEGIAGTSLATDG